MKNIIYVMLCLTLCFACKKDVESVKPINIDITNGSDFTDERDGKVYKTIKIGNQTWMAENLNYRFAQGSLDGCFTYKENSIILTQVPIDKNAFIAAVNLAVANKEIVDPEGLPAMQRPTIIISLNIRQITPRQLMDRLFVYPDVFKVINRIYDSLLISGIVNLAKENKALADLNNGEYDKKYGLLYTFTGAVNAVPEGWRLPTDEDWKELEGSLGMERSEIEKLDEWRGTQEGKLLKGTSEDKSFNATLGGGRLYGTFMYGTPFLNKEVNGYYWSSSERKLSDSTDLVIIRSFMNSQDKILRATSRKEAAYHIRCIKD